MARKRKKIEKKRGGIHKFLYLIPVFCMSCSVETDSFASLALGIKLFTKFCHRTLKF